MAKWLAPALVVAALAVAASVGAAVWSLNGDGAGCDRSFVEALLRDGISEADSRGQAQFKITPPAHCGDDELADLAMEVTRAWHMMGGGVMMREASHSAPSP